MQCLKQFGLKHEQDGLFGLKHFVTHEYIKLVNEFDVLLHQTWELLFIAFLYFCQT